jgi:putative OPT family oligopeptide transporter
VLGDIFDNFLKPVPAIGVVSGVCPHRGEHSECPNRLGIRVRAMLNGPMAPPPSASEPSPELTVRAVLTGMALGALLTPCNVYSGLKIGWAFNMSVAAGLLGFAFWRGAEHLAGARHWPMRENNINQTAASSAAAIISSGLAAPIPALALLTGQELPWHLLAFWLFAVSALGVVVAAGLRNQMLERQNLVFPSGVATAETMRHIHSGIAEAAGRLRVLFSGMAVAAALKLFNAFVYAMPRLAPPLKLSGGASLGNLGFALDPSLLMVGFGAIAGMRASLSALLGGVIAWGLLGPMAVSRGWAEAGSANPDVSWFAPLVEWLLWPGATLMVVAALVSFLGTIARLAARRRRGKDERARPTRVMDPRAFVAALAAVLLLGMVAQSTLFSIGTAEAIVAVLLSFGLAVVAGWVSGQTGITPVGALGKITQLSFALVSPGNVTANLMSANVTGGAAGQCADMLHDLRTGQIIGATPRFQIVAQMFGVLTGSLAGAAAYLLIIPDPRAMLITPDWPAPAVATWKAVAEVLSAGLGAMPEGSLPAMALAALVGLVLALAEIMASDRVAQYLPSATAMGLGFVIPAWNSLSLFLGALGALVIARFAPEWARHKLVVLAAGLVVGESLAGVVAALATLAE